jgi:hypothetical protein
MLKTTKEQQRRFARDFFPKGRKSVHHVWFKLQKELGPDWEKTTDQDSKYQLMRICEKFARKHPTDVYVSSCDDSVYAGSRLVYIVHESVDNWHGITVLMIPQCDGRPPAQFFLYESHLDCLIKKLTRLQKRQRVGMKREKIAGKKQIDIWNRYINKEVKNGNARKV